VNTADIDELLATSRMAGASLLTGYENYLRERFAAGCTDAARLTREITDPATGAARRPSVGSCSHRASLCVPGRCPRVR